MSYGLEQAGLTCVLGIDNNKYAIDTFSKNHPNSTGVCGDIRKLNPKDIKIDLDIDKIDLICGGPPCQGFSTVGLGNPEDERNHLFLHFYRFVEYFRPRYIVIENVTGLVAKKNENTLKAIYEVFRKIGYKLDIRILKASDYDVPQDRKRTIILGNNLSLKNNFPEPSSSKGLNTVDFALKNSINFNGKTFNNDVVSSFPKNDIDKKRISHIPEGRSIRYEKDELEFLPENLRFNIDWGILPEKRFREAKYRRLDRKKPSPTIVTHKNTLYHPTENRHLTIREAAAMQSFPANFEFLGSNTSQWTQVGNAVPPLLAKSIGEAILKTDSEMIKEEEDVFDFNTLRSTAFKYA